MEVPCYCQTFLYHFPSWFRSWFFPNCSQRAWEVPWQPCSNGCLTSLQRQGGWSWQVLCTSSYHFHSWPIWMGKTSYDRKIGSSGKPKTQARKMLPVTFGIHKTFLLAPSLRGWVRNQYTATPNAVEEPMRSFRKPRTAASFVPKACKTQASKNASRYLWRP